MTTYVLRNGKLVEKRLAAPISSQHDAPHVISDTMDATRNMCDGKYYTSKAKFREVTRAHGCIEVGNEVAAITKPRQPEKLSRERRRDEIRRVIAQLKG